MKVRILSGNQTGHVVEMQQIEGEIAIQTGYGVKVPDNTPKHPKEVPVVDKDEADAEAASKVESEAAMTELVDELEGAERRRRRRG